MTPHKLTLKPRGVSPEGITTWHDMVALTTALANIANGKKASDVQLWLAVAGKIENATPKNYGRILNTVKVDDKEQAVRELPPFTIALSTQQRRNLWKELADLPLDKFFAGGKVLPNIGHLVNMLRDFAFELGFDLPFEDDEPDAADGPKPKSKPARPAEADDAT